MLMAERTLSLPLSGSVTQKCSVNSSPSGAKLVRKAIGTGSLITSRVENLSMADRKFNITTSIVVGYDSDVAQVQSILCAAAKAQARVMTDPEPVTYLASFAPDGLEFTLNFWVADPDKGKDNVRSAINIAILEGLRSAGVDIPYPQRVLRVESLPPGVSATREAAV